MNEISDKKTLLFFTHSYPFGNQENFIETELPYLAKVFDEIIIIPFVYGKSHQARLLPNNVTIFKPILNERSKIKIFLGGIFNRRSIKPFLSELHVTKLKNLHKLCLHTIIARYLASDRIINKLFLKENSLAYFYWGVNWANILSFCKAPIQTIVRFHGYDLYEERGAYLPFREAIFKKADFLVFISNHGLEYAKNKFANRYDYKFRIFKLGVKDLKQAPSSTDGVLRIASCSNLVPIKRVDLISKAIQRISDIKIEWVHFGDGPTLEKIKDNHSLIFKGRKPNQDILKYYEENPVDLFINVSLSEGLPVSIMEAISAGIPVIATDAGGTKELIENVLPSNIDEEQLAFHIKEFYNNHYQDHQYREYYKRFWEVKVNAEKNYRDFALFLDSQITTIPK